jgi:hypothetical protein
MSSARKARGTARSRLTFSNLALAARRRKGSNGNEVEKMTGPRLERVFQHAMASYPGPWSGAVLLTVIKTVLSAPP